MRTITDHAALIDALGGNTAVAEFLSDRPDLGDCTAVRVGQWKIGGRIPVEYWPGIIAMSRTKDLAFVDSDWLMNTTPQRKRKSAAA